MIARTIAFVTVFAVAAGFPFSSSRGEEPLPGVDASIAFKAGDFLMTGPHTQENLTIYLIHGPDHAKGRTCLTLAEAIRKKAAIVHETSAANELAVENVSADVDVYIQAGEVVKGGLQDRTFTIDHLLSPRSGFVPVKVFCVDLGRWEARPGESVDRFDDAPGHVAGKFMKFCVLRTANQEQVWAAIKVCQRKLAAGVGRNVADAKWPNAWQLTMENKAVQQAAAKYTQRLASIVDPSAAGDRNDPKAIARAQENGQGNIIGCAVVVNGKLSSIDVYSSHGLFAALWPRLLHAAAIEACAEAEKGKAVAPANPEAIKAVLESLEHLHPAPKDVAKRTVVVRRETKDAMMFETFDRLDPRAGAPGSWVHRSYLTKAAYNPPAPPDAGSRPIIVPR